MPDITQLDAVKAQRFLRSLPDRPFVAVVMEGERLRVYCKGLSELDAARIMGEVAEQIEQEHVDADT